MARKKSPVDAALEVARKVRVPKKPVKAKGKKTVPTKLDWGPGIPEDKLAYLNDEEMALVQAKRGYKGKRSVDGIPAFPDPGDTAAGDRGTGSSGRPSSGGSSGPDRGPTGGPSSGNGGLGGGGKGGTSGGAGGAGGLGGGGKGGPSGGAGGTSSSSAGTGAGAGSSDKGQKTTGPSGGPSGGPTSAPARTAPSATVSTSSDRTPSISQSSGPVTFGPTSSSQQTFVRTSAPTGGYNPVSSAPSTMAYQGALDRIAQGSSVVGGRPTGKMQDRVPQAQPSTVSFSQAPTVGPNRGIGGLSVPQEDYTIGANSPFASPGVSGYNREAYNIPSVSPSAPSNILGPSVPAGTAIQKDPYYSPEQTAMRFRGNPTAQPAAYAATDPRVAQTPIGSYPAPSPIAQDPSLAGRALDAQTLGEQLAFASRAAANTIGDYIGSTARNAGEYVGSLFGGEPTMQAAAVPSINPQTGLPYGEKMQDRLPGYGAPATVSPAAEALALQKAIDENRMKAERDFASAIGENVYGGPPSSSIASSTPGKTRGVTFSGDIPKPSVPPSGMPPTSYGPIVGTVEDPYNQRYAKTASYMGAIPSAGNESASAAISDKPTEVTVLGYPGPQADISPSQGDYSPSQAPAYDVSPSQQSGWTDAQREAYLSGLAGSRQGPVRPILPNRQTPPVTQVASVPPTYLQPLPDWQDYSYLYNDYPQIVSATPAIAEFNQYNATMNRGGRIGNSIDAAMRLARQSIVSRNKTR